MGVALIGDAMLGFVSVESVSTVGEQVSVTKRVAAVKTE